jgi:hypothetical protein
MTLDEAIMHCNDVSGECQDKCSFEHEQLAKWLMELKGYRETLNLRGKIFKCPRSVKDMKLGVVYDK